MLTQKELKSIDAQVLEIAKKHGGEIHPAKRKLSVITKLNGEAHLREMPFISLSQQRSIGGLSVELIAVPMHITPVVGFSNDEFQTLVGKIETSFGKLAILEMRFPF